LSRKRRWEILEDCRVTLNACTDDRLAQAQDDLDHVAPTFRAAVQRLMDARPGTLGAQSFDSPSVSGGGGGSPTERAAFTASTARNDIAALDAALRILQRHAHHPLAQLGKINAACLVVRRTNDAWVVRRPSDKDQRLSVERANEPECAHHRAFGTYEPVHRTTDGGGLLTLPLPLCRWCYDRLRRDGVLPSADRLQRLADGRGDRVKVAPARHP
jgi:hypothetical protein